MTRNINVVDYETLTVAGSAVSLSTRPNRAKSFIGTLETGTIRVRGDGTAPTSSEGELMNIGDKVYLSESEFEAIQFIRTTSTSGVIKGHYYDVELPVLLNGG